jgi:hypothetical protein
VPGLDGLGGAGGGLQPQGVRGFERSVRPERRHVVLFEQKGHALRQSGHHLVLALVHAVHVKAVAVDDDPVVAQVGHVGVQLRAVDHGFRGDAAHVEARAPEGGVLLHDGGLEAELGGLDRRHIPPGTAADDDNIKRIHGCLASCRYFSRRRPATGCGSGSGGKPNCSRIRPMPVFFLQSPAVSDIIAACYGR